MLFSLNWLRDYVDVLEDPRALAHRLTMAGLPVDRVEEGVVLPETVVVGRVLEAVQHPNADRLRVCTVDVGAGEPLQIVCGAPNARAGILSPVATVGSALPNGLTIRKSKIRGEVSFGMICSAVELGLGEESDGIMELSEGTPGQPYAELLGAPDVLLDVDIPSNRGDCMSHLGLAREIAALTGAELRIPENAPAEAGAPAAEQVEVAIEDFEDCPRYIGRVVRGVKIGPSPAWLARRLEAIGQRSINNVVDVTNFVLQEFGQPLHAFDLDRLTSGKILVRRAQPGEVLTTLDDVERKLDPEMLMITDGTHPVAVAGVMGGADSEVQDDTVNLLLESAVFRPGRVLRGSRRLKLDTEASLRFRRGVDPRGTAWAVDRAARLIAELGGGTVAPGRVDVCEEGLLDPRRVVLRPERVGALLGETLASDEIRTRLESFGFQVHAGSAAGDPWSVEVPSWRLDILEECDLTEEVARHAGYDTIGVRDYNRSAVNAPVQESEVRRRRVGEVLRGFGFHEALTHVLCDHELPARAGLDPEVVERSFFPLLDPSSREEEGLRVSLLPGLLQAVSHNLRHGHPEVRLYELGKIFRRRGDGELPAESLEVGMAASGGDFGPSRERSGRKLEFLDFKGFVEAFLEAFKIDAPSWRAYTGKSLIPGGALELLDGEAPIGYAWEVDRKTLSDWDLKRPVYLAQIGFDALAPKSAVPVRHQDRSRFPAVRRDLALVVPRALLQDEVRRLVMADAGAQLETVEMFDHYTGKHIPEGYVGLGYSLTFRAPDRTLEEAEVDAAVDRIVTTLSGKGITRREG